MARRRRGLLGRGTTPKAVESPASTAEPAGEGVVETHPEPSPSGTDAPADEATEMAGPPPAAEGGDSYADDPTVDEVVEPSYVGTGRMGEDTTDDGWGRSVWDQTTDEEADAQERPPSASPPEGAERSISYSQSTPDLPEAHEQTYPSPTGAPPKEEGGSAGGANDYTAPALQDAPIAQGLYGEYSDFDGGAPPTEEVPSSVMEDVGAAYNAPMNVPEPPPIPGILDRFTPPPVERSGYSQPQAPSGGSNAGLPDYLSGVDHGDTSEEDLPVPPGRRKKEKAYVSTPAPTRDDDEEGRGGPPMVVILGGLGLLAAAAGAVLFVVWLALGGLSSGGTAEGPTKEGSPLEVRQDMQREPGLIGVEPKPAAQPEVPEPTPEPDAPEPAPEPAPSAQPATAPKPTPTPRPQPKPAPVAAPKPAATVGTLKVDANRRVLIKVNGQPKGFTPQRLELPPGTYKVSAVMPGQADTEKEKSVTISAPGTTVGVDFAF